MRTAWLKLLTLMCVMLAVLAVMPGCEEPTDPSLEPPEIETPSTAPKPATATSPAAVATPATPRTPAEYRKAAEAGDVPSMLLLGRSHESLGQKTEARKWYQRAAESGNEDGKAALAQLDAPPTTRDASSTTPPTDAASGNGGGGSTAALPRRIPVATLPAGDPTKLRWVDIGAVLNYDDMISDGRVMPGPNNQEVFIGRTTSRDASILVVAVGPSDGDLHEVTSVIRVKNKVDPGTSPRVAQAGALTARITSDNVNQREFLEWITKYLQTEQRSEPIFRNGWRITISGYAAEDKRDPKPQLGTAVMIEMKK